MAENEGTETIEAPEEEAAAPEIQVAEGQPSAQPQAADDFAGFDDATKKRVSDIVSKRINAVNTKYKPYEAFGKPEELQQRLTRAEQLEKWAEDLRQRMSNQQPFPGQNQQPGQQLTEEDKKVLAYLERIQPGFSKMKEELQFMRQTVTQQAEFRWQQLTQSNQGMLKDIAKNAGYDEALILGQNGIEQHVANSIMANREDHARYMQTGDSAIVKKHFDIVHNWVQGLAPKPPVTPNPAAANYAAGKTKAKALPPRMPAAGVPAPTAGSRKMTDKERITGAFDRLKGS